MIELISNWIIVYITATKYIGIFVLMVLESCGIPLPSEVTMPFSGYLVFQNQLNFWLVVFIGAFANLVGSLIAYAIGFYGGRPLIEKYGKYILLKKHDLQLAENWFAKWGRPTAFFSRMLPVVRTYISFPAGIAKMPIIQFSLYTFIGSLPWSWLLTLIGVKMGENWENIRQYFHIADIAILIIIIYFIGKNLIKKYGNNSSQA
ncbi:MAG: snare associated golgi protein-like protein [Candidatus Berkelbacteria bacterium Licking1014_85]|uniref:Snare associated golgi protein-like protein n=1 Tax=Candidatus Berkelbacteria bacterium Licking1014_85 TaxID=2017148 RepID=A0A554LLR6_9BACT|nr:MAG: snare associated golgi protein-like protein [Candidatus Berkelbacteria bacterium Licking1014_85]